MDRATGIDLVEGTNVTIAKTMVGTVASYEIDAAGGGGGTVYKLYDYTVAGSDKASIDTNVDGTTVANFAGFAVLDIMVIARTDAVAATGAYAVTLNNDTSAIYDNQAGFTTQTTQGGSASLAQTGWNFICHGSGGSASYAGAARITIPGYAGTTFWKSAVAEAGNVDATAANNYTYRHALGYRSTSAVTRIKIAATGNFKVGSRLIVFGR